jgi:hypothetical protein
VEREERGMIGPAATSQCEFKFALRSPVHVQCSLGSQENGAKLLVCGEGTELELNPEF